MRSCDAQSCEVEQSGDSTTLEFRPDGALTTQEHRNPDGSNWKMVNRFRDDGKLILTECPGGEGGPALSLHEYDDSGRLVRIIAQASGCRERVAEIYTYEGGRKSRTVFVDPAAHPPNAWGVEGTDSIYPSHGATRVTTVYDEHERPEELLFCKDDVLGRVNLRYDEKGNMVEELQSNSREALPQELIASLNPEQLDAVGTLFGIAAPNRRVHRYDQRGRRIETRRRMGPMIDERSTTEYNDLGDKVRQSTEETVSEFALDDQGQLSEHLENRRTSRSEARFLYDYDERGNWLKKTVETRSGENTEFTVSTIERRAIEYFD